MAGATGHAATDTAQQIVTGDEGSNGPNSKCLRSRAKMHYLIGARIPALDNIFIFTIIMAQPLGEARQEIGKRLKDCFMLQLPSYNFYSKYLEYVEFVSFAGKRPSMKRLFATIGELVVNIFIKTVCKS